MLFMLPFEDRVRMIAKAGQSTAKELASRFASEL